MENKNKAIIIFYNHKNKTFKDIMVPLDITVNDFIIGLNSAYNLEINILDIRECYLKSNNPIALLKGNKQLSHFGIRNGTLIYYAEVPDYE